MNQDARDRMIMRLSQIINEKMNNHSEKEVEECVQVLKEFNVKFEPLGNKALSQFVATILVEGGNNIGLFEGGTPSIILNFDRICDFEHAIVKAYHLGISYERLRNQMIEEKTKDEIPV